MRYGEPRVNRQSKTGRFALALAAFLAMPVAVSQASETREDVAALRQRVEVDPENDAARFELANRLLRTTSASQALAHFTILAERHPQNVDYALGRAQALTRLERPREALAELERGIELAPDYEALWRLQFALLNAHPELIDAAELESRQSRARARFPEARWWRARSEPRDLRGQLTLSLTLEDLDGDRPGWNAQSVRVGWAATERTRLFAAAGRDERFDRADRSFALGIRQSFLERWHAGLELERGSDVSFLPEDEVSAFIGRQFDHGWVGELRSRRLNYETATVTVWSARVERYFSDYRVAYTLHASRLHGLTNAVSHALDLNWYRDNRSSYGITVAYGDEAEAVGLSRVLETEVGSVTVTGRHDLGGRYGLAWWLGIHEQGSFYRRRYAGMAVTAGFE